MGTFGVYSWMVYESGAGEERGMEMLTEDAKSGKLKFQERNCIACHQLYGLGGYMGPDLTNVISAAGKGPAYAESFLRNGSSRMPDFDFSEEEIRQLLAFLAYVDKTGISPPTDAVIEKDGSLTLPGSR
ncbi:MAG: cytochrome c [Bacteroidia bacterium]|nr:cytochrome c [Bacteroidia bacterium]